MLPNFNFKGKGDPPYYKSLVVRPNEISMETKSYMCQFTLTRLKYSGGLGITLSPLDYIIDPNQ